MRTTITHFLVNLAGALLVLILALPVFAAKETLVLAVGGENTEGYDPLLGWGRYGNPLFQSTLLRRKADMQVVGDLAKTWTLSEDRLLWTVTLREDVRFSDGTPLSAEDVAFTYTKALDSGGKVDIFPLASAQAVGPYTVELHLSQPDTTFLQHLLSLGIVPKATYTAEYGRKPVGSGPYMFVSWDEGQQLVVKANPHYYGHKPSIRKVVFLFADEDAALAAARAGKVDVLGVPSSMASQKIPGMRLLAVQSVDNRGLMFPVVPDTGKKTPFGAPIGNSVTADLAVRKAINFAIDRQALVTGILESYGSPAFGVVDGLPWDNAQIRFTDADPERARKILAEAGWKDSDGDGIVEKNGLKAEIPLVYNAKDSLRQGLALAVTDMLKPIGIKMVPRGENWDRIKTELTHSVVVVYGFGDNSPLEMYKLYHTPGNDPGYWNAGFYSNPVVDAYLDEARNASSFEEAIPLWQKAQWDGKTGLSALGDAPWAWLVNLDHTYFVATNLDTGKAQIEPHGHGWPITANINEWKWRQ